MPYKNANTTLFHVALVPFFVSLAITAGCDDSGGDGDSSSTDPSGSDLEDNGRVKPVVGKDGIALIEVETGDVEKRLDGTEESFGHTLVRETDFDNEDETVNEVAPAWAIYLEGETAYKVELREDGDRTPQAIGNIADIEGLELGYAEGRIIGNGNSSVDDDWYLFRPGPDTWVHALPLNGDDATTPIELDGITDPSQLTILGDDDQAKVLVEMGGEVEVYDHDGSDLLSGSGETISPDEGADNIEVLTTARETAFIAADTDLYTYRPDEGLSSKAIHSFAEEMEFPAEDAEYLYLPDGGSLYRIGKGSQSTVDEIQTGETNSVYRVPGNAAWAPNHVLFWDSSKIERNGTEETVRDTLYSVPKDGSEAPEPIFEREGTEYLSLYGVSKENATLQVVSRDDQFKVTEAQVICAPLDGSEDTRFDAMTLGAGSRTGGDLTAYMRSDFVLTAGHESGTIGGQPMRLRDANGTCEEARTLGNVPSEVNSAGLTTVLPPGVSERFAIGWSLDDETNTNQPHLLWMDLEEADSLKILDGIEEPDPSSY